MQFEITGQVSADRVATMLKVGAKRGQETRTVMDRIVADMMLTEEKIFASQGRRGGGSWKKLKPSTVARKGTSEILRTRGARRGYSKFPVDSLFKSLTKVGSSYQVLNVTRTRILFGTDHPYAEVISSQRPFMKFTNNDADKWKAMLAEHLMAPFMGDK